jgi:hypothetical protein
LIERTLDQDNGEQFRQQRQPVAWTFVGFHFLGCRDMGCRHEIDFFVNGDSYFDGRHFATKPGASKLSSRNWRQSGLSSHEWGSAPDRRFDREPRQLWCFNRHWTARQMTFGE